MHPLALVLVWISFSWLSVPGAPHAGIAVPVKLDGQKSTVWMQLDTGSPGNYFYLDQLRHEAPGYPDFASIRGTIGTMRVEANAITGHFGTDGGESPTLVGTLGTAAFAGHILALDLRRSRLTIVSRRRDLPEQLQHVAYTPFNPTGHAQPWISIHVGGDVLSNVLVDTGSSSLSLVLRHREIKEPPLQAALGMTRVFAICF